jgi:thymidylate kinase
MIIAFLGVDGSGKSTVIKEFTKKASSSWSEIRYIHFRPNLFQKNISNTPITKPHAGKSRGLFMSIIKIIYFIVEYNIAFIQNYFKPNQLIIYDRYCYDIIADPKRTKFTLPLKFSNFMMNLIPSPDLIYYLYAPIDILYDRKQEINKSDLKLIHENYLFLSKINNFHEVNTNASLEITINNILLIYNRESLKKL